MVQVRYLLPPVEVFSAFFRVGYSVAFQCRAEDRQAISVPDKDCHVGELCRPRCFVCIIDGQFFVCNRVVNPGGKDVCFLFPGIALPVRCAYHFYTAAGFGAVCPYRIILRVAGVFFCRTGFRENISKEFVDELDDFRDRAETGVQCGLRISELFAELRIPGRVCTAEEVD